MRNSLIFCLISSMSVFFLHAQVIPVTNGLMLNLDANKGLTKTGNNVTKWDDQSGRSNHVGTTSLTFPTAGTFNGKASVNFSGAQRMDLVTMNTDFNPTEATMFVAMNNHRAAVMGVLSVAENSDRTMNEYLIQQGVFHHSAQDSFSGLVSNCVNSIPSTESIVMAGVYGTNAGYSDIFFYLNGDNTSSNFLQKNGMFNQGVPYTNVPRRVLIGARSFKGNQLYVPFSGSIHEIVIFNRKLSNTEVVSVSNYLKTKWGINRLGCGLVSSIDDHTANTGSIQVVELDQIPRIAYNIEQNDKSYDIVITDAKGNQLFKSSIQDRGEGILSIDPRVFQQTGIYFISMLEDGRIAETKKWMKSE